MGIHVWVCGGVQVVRIIHSNEATSAAMEQPVMKCGTKSRTK